MMPSNPFLPGFTARYTEVRGAQAAHLRGRRAGRPSLSSTASAAPPRTGRWSRRLWPGAAACSCRSSPATAARPRCRRRWRPSIRTPTGSSRCSTSPAVLVGHSLGAVVALRAGRSAPGRRPRRSSSPASAGIGSGTRRAERALTLVAFVKPGKRLSRRRRAVAATPSAQARRVRLRRRRRSARARPAGGRRLPRRLRAVHGRAHCGRCARAHRSARRPRARSLPCARAPRRARPSGAASRRDSEYARLLDAPLRVIADCGHLLNGERPDAVRRRDLRVPTPDWGDRGTPTRARTRRLAAPPAPSRRRSRSRNGRRRGSGSRARARRGARAPPARR